MNRPLICRPLCSFMTVYIHHSFHPQFSHNVTQLVGRATSNSYTYRAHFSNSDEILPVRKTLRAHLANQLSVVSVVKINEREGNEGNERNSFHV